MTLHPATVGPVPEETARVARAAFPKGNVYMWMRDELGVLYTDDEFAALFAARGQPAEAPWRLVLVTIMQFLEGLSDRQAADGVRSRIDWKYALGLELTHAGVDASVLSEFRTRLVEGQVEERLLAKMLELFKTKGWLKARGRQRTDATHVLAAVRKLTYLTCVGETMRYVLNHLAEAAPEWLTPHLQPEWAERYGHRLEEGRLPREAAARQALAETIGRDGLALWEALQAPHTPEAVRQHPAVEILRQVWTQQYDFSDGQVRWRQDGDHPPAARMINSPLEVEARVAKKRETVWSGYKVHLTETCDDDQPRLITHVLTTEATTNDSMTPDQIHADLARQDLLPSEHFLDAGYVEGALIVGAQEKYGIEIVGRAPGTPSWQARAGNGFDMRYFQIDWGKRRVTCPAGQVSVKWSATHNCDQQAIINVRFSVTACRACVHHTQCTRTAGARNLTLRPQAAHQALQAARQNQRTPEFQKRYGRRAGIEGTFTQANRLADLRHARYLGRAKTHLQHVFTALALNIRRVFAWATGEPLARTRIARFVLLMPAAPVPAR